MAETGYTKNLHIKQYNQGELANDTLGLDWTLSINGDNADSMANVIDEFAGKTNEEIKELKDSYIKEVKVNGSTVNRTNNSVNIKIPTKMSDLVDDGSLGNHEHSYLKNGQNTIMVPNQSGSLVLKSDLPIKLPADGGNSDTVDNKHANEFVQMPKNGLSIADLNDANYPEAYRSEVSESDSTSLGLPSGIWAIDYYRHLDNNGYGFQVAYPLTNSTQNLPRWRSSVGTTWNNWKEMGGGGQANGGNADTVDNKHANEFVQMPRKRMSVTDLNNANYPNAYRTSVSDADAPSIGLNARFWHIDYYRHLDNNGYGFQVAYPLDGHDVSAGYVPKWRQSVGTTWKQWIPFGYGCNADTVDNVHASQTYVPELHIPTCGKGASLEVSEWIDFHKSAGDTSDYLSRIYVETTTGDLCWSNIVDTNKNMNITNEILNLKKSVVNGKQAVVDAINNRLGYGSGLTTAHSGVDYAWWINNKIPKGANLSSVTKVSYYTGSTYDTSTGRVFIFASTEWSQLSIQCLSGQIIAFWSTSSRTLNVGDTITLNGIISSAQYAVNTIILNEGSSFKIITGDGGNGYCTFTAIK